LWRCSDFFEFQDGSHCHLGFLNFKNLIGCLIPGPRYITMSNFIKIGQPIAEILQFFDYSRWRPSAILDLFGANLDHPQRVIGGLYHYAKFDCNQCSSFKNMKV